MAGKYYAVRVGKTPGIYRTWDECKDQIHGYPCAAYKSFKTEEEAKNFMGLDEADTNTTSKDGENLASLGVVAYVDGSYNKLTKEFSYGMIILRDGKEFKYAGKYDDAELATMNNVAGEIKGAQEAMRYAMENSLDSITIYHDYEGIAKWCRGEWKTNKDGTKAYKAYYDSIKDRVKIRFVKVAGHSNDKYNDIADELAKQALGLIEPVHELDIF